MERIAPDELPVVAAYAQQKPSLVARRLRSRRRRRDPLAFGVDAEVSLVAPFVWLAVNEAVKRMGGNFGDGVSKRIQRVIRRLARRDKAEREKEQAEEAITFAAEQLRVVHTVAIESASRHGLSAKRAGVMADSIVAMLALVSTAHTPATTRTFNTPPAELPPPATSRQPESGNGGLGGASADSSTQQGEIAE